ncbi:MAG: zinc-ribbon and DUF3426 domain-containing protein [Steroidobacteraceae bacterium]
MFTTCPKCALNLAITAADLRIGQGYVRCGRCSNVFNALVGLADEGEHSLEAPMSAQAEAPAGEPQGSGMLVESSLVEGDPGTGTFETIILEGDGIMQTTEVVAEDEVELQLRALAERIEAANHRMDEDESEAAQQAVAAIAAIPVEDSGEMEVIGLREQVDLDPGFDDAEQVRGRMLRNLARFGVAALALLLVIQIVHHYRAHLSGLKPLVALYEALGLQFDPPIDLLSYDVRQLGYEPSPTAKDSVLIRATVSNVSKAMQPLPVLRVTMQDRFGNLASRVEIAPRDYLLAQSGARPLAPGARVDAQIQVKMPDQRVDYQLDACAADRMGQLRCADDRGPFQ